MTDTSISSDTTAYELGMTGTLCTRDGLNILSAALAGQELKITRVAIGSGEMTGIESEEEYRLAVLNMKSMINWRMDIPIVECKNLGDGRMLLHVRKPNAEVPEGFFARERAVFAINPDDNTERLFSYINTGDMSSFIPSNTGPIAKIIDFGIITIIQNAKNVEVKLDASFAYVAMSEYTDHVDSEVPHPNTPSHYLDVSNTNRFWAVDEDDHLHEISAANAREVLLGDAAKLYPSIGKTITDNKSKIDELDMRTKALNELGLEANLMMVEDFAPSSVVDEFKVKVLSCAAGGRLIGVENDDGILKGRYYWISDGVNQELVQVIGVAYSTDYYHVTLAEGLTYSYNLDTVYMYRSTLTGGVGIVDAKYLKWSPPNSFKGIEANIARELVFNSSMSNAAAMQIEGEGIVTTEGYFTLVNDYGSYTYSEGGGTGGSGDQDNYVEGYLSDEQADKIFNG